MAKGLLDFYKIMSPIDGRMMQASVEGAPPPVEMSEDLMDVYVRKATPGNQIIDELNDEPDAGYLFVTMNQPARNPAASYLQPDPSDDNNTKSVYFDDIENFYDNVCAPVGAASGGPPVDITINILRTSGLTESTRNVDEIEFFLNNMPSIFPSQMSPYLNVEIELPTLKRQDKDKTTAYINRPSLERFLMGSSLAVGFEQRAGQTVKTIALSTVDYALISAIKPKPTANPSPTESDGSSFMGMEMFTSPQTLTNMDQLDEKTGVRLNAVKPFLPPATILGATIQTRNGGAGTFLHKTVDLELKIHDKARLAEFSEFLSGPSGTRNVVVWLTYGWLSPRGRDYKDEDRDYYAKFINENMLVREAFEVKNSSFSFDVVGQVTVKVELVSKGITAIDSAKINNSLTPKQEEAAKNLQFVKDNRDIFGKRSQDSSNNMKIYQILDAAIADDLSVGMDPKMFGDAIKAAEEMITASSMSPARKEQANKVITALNNNYAVTPGALRSNLDIELTKSVANRLQLQFAKCGKNDPFKPSEKTLAGKRFFTAALVEALAAPGTPKKLATAAEEDQRKLALKKFETENPAIGIASFGKLFCTFCMEPLVKQAELDGVNEVQISFYQLNESCGPVSLHNIAEFPIDIDSFKVQFAEFCMLRGGESISIQEFLKFALENQFADNRSPGYGMRQYYEPFDMVKSGAASLSGADDGANQSNMAKWTAKYGEFKMPDISFKIETIIENSSRSKVDLLHHLQSDVGSMYKEQDALSLGSKKIKKICIYDKQLSPYTQQIQLIDAGAGKFAVYNGQPLDELYTKKSTNPTKESSTDVSTTNPAPATTETPAPAPKPYQRELSGGKNLLKEYITTTVPTLTIGANGSLITSITLASKTSGLIGTNNLQGGSAKASSTLSPNGLSMSQNSLPVRLSPAQLTMTSLGCPIAELYQQYFVDFGTGTTIDNLYAVTQLSHTIAPGKFETSWTFAYADGYGKFFGAPVLSDFIVTPSAPAPESKPPLATNGKRAGSK